CMCMELTKLLYASFLFLFNSLICILSPPSLFSTLSLHDALPIYRVRADPVHAGGRTDRGRDRRVPRRLAPVSSAWMAVAIVGVGDRKSTRLNSSHVANPYAVFCLKKFFVPEHGTMFTLALVRFRP